MTPQLECSSQTSPRLPADAQFVPSRLHRYQQARDLHFITFSCYQRESKLGTDSARSLFEQSLETTRIHYRFCVIGYVVMPEHVHLLLSEPATDPLFTALQALKQSVSRKFSLRVPRPNLLGRAWDQTEPFWQERYYDFNVWTERKRVEKLRYIHRNPVIRGLVAAPEDWKWSSFRHYATGLKGAVEIESFWTAWERDHCGIRPEVLSRRRASTPP